MVARAVPTQSGLGAPTHWQCVDLISDLHLQASDEATFAAWQGYMATTPADAVFILGDLFEVWVGDDSLKASSADGPMRFEQRCQVVLRDSASRLSVYFMHGNRDFLFGTEAALACNLTLLADPTTLNFDGQRWLLSHGDALCTDDTAYQAFRSQVRSEAWQTRFLSAPLSERDRVARELRSQSEAHKQRAGQAVDVDADTAAAWLREVGAQTLIHGHTHKPGQHPLPGGGKRMVLSDWDAAAAPQRLEIVRLAKGQPPSRLTLQQARST